MNEKTKEQETESRPEDAQASEQVKAVVRQSPNLEGLTPIHDGCMGFESWDCPKCGTELCEDHPNRNIKECPKCNTKLNWAISVESYNDYHDWKDKYIAAQTNKENKRNKWWNFWGN